MVKNTKMTESKKDKRKNNGGAREGSGRPRLFKNPTVINFRVEESVKKEVKDLYGKTLNSLFGQWIQELISKKKNDV